MSTAAARRIFTSCEFIVLAVVILALRIAYARGLKFDIDEPQHLHVVWAWTVGKLPYRDVFDNHAPLFQFLCAPLLRLIPERPDIVIPMRWAMLPLYGLAVYAIYRLAAVFYSPKLALLISVSGTLLPRYFFKAAEFRPDDLWAAVWFLALAVLMGGPVTVRRSLLFGLWMGVLFSISLKTTLFVLSLGLALLILIGLQLFDKSQRIDWKHLLKCISSAALAALLLPAIVVLCFWRLGVIHQFYYCLIQHNIIPQLKHWRDPGYAHLWFPLTLVGLLIAAIVIYRRCATGEQRHRQVLTFLVPGCYVLILYGFWPDIPFEDDLPLYPLIPLSCCLLGSALLSTNARAWIGRYATGAAWVVIVLQLGWLYTSHRPLDRANRDQIAEIATILQLVNRDEFVMDPVAGAVYRQRPYYYALETITKTRIRFHLTEDNIRQRLVDTGTKVAMPEGMWHFSKSREFVDANYVPLKDRANIRVAGKYMVKDPATPSDGYAFDVTIPAQYSIVDEQGRVAGTLDGSACNGPRELSAGHHEFVPKSEPTNLALFWERALEKGYRPEFTDPEKSPRKVKSGS